jgi:DNA repair ATPase RecN
MGLELLKKTAVIWGLAATKGYSPIREQRGVWVYIERIQVEEGFLDGLDIRLVPGLNVLIGGRGTGKTSVVELIRFCLGVEGHTTDIGKKANEHALSILEGGRITLTINLGHDRMTLARSPADRQPKTHLPFQAPLIFSQTEIELLGLEDQGRLRMIDDFIVEGSPSFEASIGASIGHARSYTVEVRNLAKEIDALEEQIRELPSFREQLKPVLEEEKGVAKISGELAKKQQEMKEVTAVSSASTVRVQSLEELIQNLSEWSSATEDAASRAPSLDGWPDDDNAVILRKQFEVMISKAERTLAEVAKQIESISVVAEKALDEAQKEKSKQTAKLRDMRTSVDGLKQGAGAIAKKVSDLRQRIASLEATKKQIEARNTRLRTTKAKRSEILDELGKAYSARFEKRREIARQLERKLAPRIKVSVAQAADVAKYSAALIGALRGSSIRYNELAPHLASRISPRELVEAAEDGNVDFVIEAAEVNRDRAQRLLAQLRDSRLEDVLLADVEDSISLQLLDGSEYKEIDNLSTGQRCTVVLPIVLQHKERTLVIDQPEDHLDNGFIVDTLIKVLRDRSKSVQLIMATHNANIPVLGEAERVVVLGSDGKRGYVQHVGNLDDEKSVTAITNLMEGGKEAFDARARFYKKHLKA